MGGVHSVRMLLAVMLAASVGSACSSSTDDAPTPTASPDAQVTRPTTTVRSASSMPPVNTERPKDTRVVFERSDWGPSWLQAEIVTQLLAELGYSTVEPQLPRQFEFDEHYAVARNTRDQRSIDVHTNTYGWHLENVTDQEGRSLENRFHRFAEPLIPNAGLQGLLITKDWADEAGIRTLEQINDDPELFGAIDSDGNGRGELRACEDGWACGDLISQTLVFAGMDNLEHVWGRPGCCDGPSYEEGFAEFMERVEAGEPTIGYVWGSAAQFDDAALGEKTLWLALEPESVLIGPDLFWRDIWGKTQRRADGVVGWTGVEEGTCTVPAAECQLGFLNWHGELAVNRAWAEANVSAATLLGSIRLDAADLTRRMQRFASPETPTDAELSSAAERWIEEHRQQTDQWLEAARTATELPPERIDPADRPGAARIGHTDAEDDYLIADFTRTLIGFTGVHANADSYIHEDASTAAEALASGELDVWPFWTPDDNALLDLPLPDGTTIGDHVTIVGGGDRLAVASEWADAHPESFRVLSVLSVHRALEARHRREIEDAYANGDRRTARRVLEQNLAESRHLANELSPVTLFEPALFGG